MNKVIRNFFLVFKMATIRTPKGQMESNHQNQVVDNGNPETQQNHENSSACAINRSKTMPPRRHGVDSPPPNLFSSSSNQRRDQMNRNLFNDQGNTNKNKSKGAIPKNSGFQGLQQDRPRNLLPRRTTNRHRGASNTMQQPNPVLNVNGATLEDIGSDNEDIEYAETMQEALNLQSNRIQNAACNAFQHVPNILQDNLVNQELDFEERQLQEIGNRGENPAPIPINRHQNAPNELSTARMNRFEVRLDNMATQMQIIADAIYNLNLNSAQPANENQSQQQQRFAENASRRRAPEGNLSRGEYNWNQRQNIRFAPSIPFANATNMKPTFTGSNEDDPQLFLSELDNYIWNFQPEYHILQAIKCFSGPALYWARGIGAMQQSYEAFRDAFIENYLGDAAERDFYQELCSGTYVPVNNRYDMAGYFLRIRADSRKCRLQMSESEFISKIALHFTDHGQYIRNCYTVQDAYQRLVQLDKEENARVQSKKPNTFANYNQTNNNNNYQRFNQNSQDPQKRNFSSQPYSNRTGNYGQKPQPSQQKPVHNGMIQAHQEILEYDQQNDNHEESLLEQETHINSIIVDGNELIEFEDMTPPTIGSTRKVQGEIEGMQIQFMIDPGSEISCISSQLYEKLVKLNKIKYSLKSNLSLTWLFANGKESKSSMQILLSFTLGDSTFDGVFCVTDMKNPEGVLLGDNILRFYGIDMMYSEMALRWKHDGKTSSVGFSDYSQTPITSESVPIYTIQIEHEIRKLTQECSTKNHLTQNQTQAFHDLLLQHKSIFTDKPGLCNKYTHKIEMKDKSPFYCKPYPIPEKHKDTVEMELQKMMEWKIIEESSTPYISPMVVVIKKDGTIRMCHDLRQLNKQIIQIHTKPDDIDQILRQFGKEKIISSIDFTKAFWQIPITRNSKKFLGFSIGTRTFVFRVLPYGMNTSTSVFMEALKAVFGQETLKFLLLFIDEGIIKSKTFEEHLNHLKIIFIAIEDANMTLNLAKCQFLRSSVSFLGHTISNEGILPMPETLSKVENFPKPKTVSQLQSFIGLMSWLRKFIPHFSAIAKPLQSAITGKGKLTWTREMENSFSSLLHAAKNIQVLSHPDPTKKLYLITDSSSEGLAAVMFHKEGTEPEILQFASRLLKPPERNYSTSESEALAIIFALKKWYIYLIGIKFTIQTDHKALTFLHQCRTKNLI